MYIWRKGKSYSGIKTIVICLLFIYLYVPLMKNGLLFHCHTVKYHQSKTTSQSIQLVIYHTIISYLDNHFTQRQYYHNVTSYMT